MSTFLIEPISAQDLATVRAGGPDPFGHRPETFIDDGGSQLRCCLVRSQPGERVALIAHAPLRTVSPWREVGPVFVHAEVCPGRAPSSEIPAWLDDGARVLRAYTTAGAMHYPANRVVETGEGIGTALAAMFAEPEVAEVHIRNLVEQCFIARAVRQPSTE